MRILVTGAGGLVGGRLAALFSSEHDVTGLIRLQRAPEGVATVSADLVDAEAVGAALSRARPEAIVHCAALADAEICEREPERATRDNEIATLTLARACAREGVRLVALSTDLVLAGDRSFAEETSAAQPVMEYGRSKLRAEAAATAAGPATVVLRIPLVYGRGHGTRLTASESVARRLRLGEGATLYEDEWRTPIDPESLADAIHAVLRRPGAKGVFHLGGPERLSRFELGRRVAEALGLDPGLLRPASQASHRGAPRARDVSLDNRRARTELGWAPRPLEVAVREGR